MKFFTMSVVGVMLFCAFIPPVRASADFSLDPLFSGYQLVAQQEARQDNMVALLVQTATVEGAVKGDVITAAKSVIVRGSVSGDVIAVADSVDIDGDVHGNVFVLANTVTVRGTIQGNMRAWGRDVQISQQGKVQQSIVWSAQQATIDGSVGWQADVVADTLAMHGSVGRSLVATVPQGDALTFGAKAKVGDTIHLTSASPAPNAESTQIAPHGVVFKPLVQGPSLGDIAFMWFLNYAGLVLLGLICLYSMPHLMARIGVSSLEMHPRTFGIGVLALIVPPVCIVILAMLIIGLPVAVVLFAIWLFCCYTAPVFFGTALGAAVMRGRGTPLIALLVGTAIVLLVTALPVIGSGFYLMIIIVVLGSWYSTLYGKRI